MLSHDIIVIGASAGGVEALSQLVKELPPNLHATLFVGLHFPSNGVSLLPQILNRYNTLPALHPRDGDRIQPGRIYVVPPDSHLIIQANHVRLSRGPRENGHRPAIDVLFQSAARTYRQRVVGVVLSGMLDDGTAGIVTIKAFGGVAIVQDPDEALFSAMPRNAIEHAHIDHILKLADIPPQLVQLAQKPIEEVKEDSMPRGKEPDHEIIAQDQTAFERGERSGSPSTLTCPDCGGVLWELRDENLVRFRCHVGHAYSLDSLVSSQTNDVEHALWSAVRALEEQAALARRMAHHAQQQNRPKSMEQFLKREQNAERNADLVRQLLLQQLETKKHYNI